MGECFSDGCDHLCRPGLNEYAYRWLSWCLVCNVMLLKTPWWCVLPAWAIRRMSPCLQTKTHSVSGLSSHQAHPRLKTQGKRKKKVLEDAASCDSLNQGLA